MPRLLDKEVLYVGESSLIPFRDLFHHRSISRIYLIAEARSLLGIMAAALFLEGCFRGIEACDKSCGRW